MQLYLKKNKTSRYFLILEAKKMHKTHIGVFRHWVELEEEGALNNLTHLTEKTGITDRKWTVNNT